MRRTSPAWPRQRPAPAGEDPGAAVQAPAGGRPAGRAGRRGRTVTFFVLAAAALFWAYLRLSGTFAVNSDSANVMLMAWDLLHGNLVLHGWYTADVPLYTTELPQYALLESFLGLRPETAHVAAAMTYTLAVLLAVALARNGTSGRTALARTLIAAGILLAPQLVSGVYALDLIVDHIGTSVPLLLIWLLLDRISRPRYWVPALTSLLLAWVLVADPVVLVVGVAPLALVGVIRFAQGVPAGDAPRWTARLRAQWYPLSLACAAGAAVLWARLADRLLVALGGFTVHPVWVSFVPWRQWPRQVITALSKVLQLYGADFRGLTGPMLALAVLHLVSVALVGWALLLAAWRFFSRTPLVDQVLAVAIVFNVVLYAITSASTQGAHEIAIVAPFGAALAARTLVRPRRADAPSPAPGGQAAGPRPATRARLAGYLAGALVLAGYLAGLGYELAQPQAPPYDSTLGPWLAAHDLSYGLAGYWQASIVTVDSGGTVAVRALTPHAMKPYLWLAQLSWYDPAVHRANFIVIDTQTKAFEDWLPSVAAIEEDVGRPSRTYRTGPYIILVWEKNLLRSVSP